MIQLIWKNKNQLHKALKLAISLIATGISLYMLIYLFIKGEHDYIFYAIIFGAVSLNSLYYDLMKFGDTLK